MPTSRTCSSSSTNAGGLHYAPEPLVAFCRANGLDVGMTLGDEDAACALICEWYLAHREAGGDKDAACEAILARLSDSAGAP
jgi:hypothetical protein